MKIWINVYKPCGNFVGVNGYMSEQMAIEHETEGCITVAQCVQVEEGFGKEG